MTFALLALAFLVTESTEPLRFTPAQLLGSYFGAEPRWPMLADLDGDGFGDLLSLDPATGHVDVALSIRGGKYASPTTVATAENGLGPSLSATIIRVASHGSADLVATRTDGTRRVLEFGADKAWHVIEDAATAQSLLEIPTTPSAVSASGQRDVVADFDGDRVLDSFTGRGFRLSSGEARAVEADALFAALASWPNAIVTAGDVNGDHRADLVLFRRDDAWRSGRDILAFLAYEAGDSDPDGDGLDAATEAAHGSDPLLADTDRDGLEDGFEVLGEGGIDFPALGARPDHQDCVVYVQRYADTDEAHCRKEVERVVQTWSELPVKNPDGRPGIALHVLWLEPLPPGTAARAWWDLGGEFLPKTARGLAHYMILSNGGGGQAAELGDMGGCGTQALWACFLHEFGHQVGLSHSGGALPGMCPTYTSLMSYAYSYGFEDDGNKIHYSRGALSGLELVETRLRERIDLPFEQLSFLAKGPFAFKLEDGKTHTRIDWNRDGTFAEGVVAADITDVYGAGCGSRFGGAGKTIFAPVLIDHRGDLVLFTVSREKVLSARVVVATDAFRDVTPLTTVATPTGDPAAIALDSQIVLAVPTDRGVEIVRGDSLAALASASPERLADSTGLSVAMARLHGRAGLILWLDAASPIRVLLADDAGGFGANGAFDLGALRSEVAPGIVEDPASGEWLVGTHFQGKVGDAEKRAWVVTRFAFDPHAGPREVSSRYVGGERAGWYGNSRPMLVIEQGEGSIAEGRLHFVGRGFANPADGNSCFYEAITIGDASSNDGWRLRRYMDEWTTTKSPIAACLDGGDLALAYRWFGDVNGDTNDDVHVMLRCFGVESTPMRDFDDVSAISELGLQRSILWRDASVR